MDHLKSVIDEIVRNYKIHSVILYGSRAGDSFREDSDYDLFCLRESGGRVRKIIEVNGESIDLIIESEEILSSPQEYLFLWNSKIILDKKGVAKKIIDFNKDYLSKKPEPIAENRLEQRKKNVQDIFKYICRGGVLGDYRRADLLSKLLPLHFSIIGEWYLGDKYALEWLRLNDQEIYSLFVKALKKESTSEEIKLLIDRVLFNI